MTDSTQTKPQAKKVKAIRIPKQHTTVAAKVRFLDSKGMARADIARQLGVRYQRVRNVLVPRVKPQDETPELESPVEETTVEPQAEELAELAS